MKFLSTLTLALIFQLEMNRERSVLHKDTEFESGKYLKMGKEHFESLYKECEDTLKKF